MRISLAPAAPERVLEATGGAFRVEIIGGVVMLVRTANGDTIPLAASDGAPPSGHNGSRLVDLVAKLSKQERQVFEQLGRGRVIAEISETMGVSQKTVETYRARIKQKLDVKQRMQLLRHAVE